MPGVAKRCGEDSVAPSWIGSACPSRASLAKRLPNALSVITSAPIRWRRRIVRTARMPNICCCSAALAALGSGSVLPASMVTPRRVADENGVRASASFLRRRARESSRSTLLTWDPSADLALLCFAAVELRRQARDEYIQDHRCIIRPDGHWARRWDETQVFLLIYLALFVPYRIGSHLH